MRLSTVDVEGTPADSPRARAVREAKRDEPPGMPTCRIRPSRSSDCSASASTVNEGGSESSEACSRTMRPQIEWKVPSQTPSIVSPASAPTRSLSCCAACCVNVTARMLLLGTPRLSSRCAILARSTRVLPVPGLASSSTELLVERIASACSLFGCSCPSSAAAPADDEC